MRTTNLSIDELEILINSSSLCRVVPVHFSGFPSKIPDNGHRFIDASFWSFKEGYFAKGMLLKILRRFPFGKRDSDVVEGDFKEFGDYINLGAVIDMRLGRV